MDLVDFGSDWFRILKQGTMIALHQNFYKMRNSEPVDIMEDLMTMEVIHEWIGSPGDAPREFLVKGAGNLVSGFMGGMGGNAITIQCRPFKVCNFFEIRAPIFRIQKQTNFRNITNSPQKSNLFSKK